MVARQVLTLEIEVRVLAGEPISITSRPVCFNKIGMVKSLFKLMACSVTLAVGGACSLSFVSDGQPSQLDIEVKHAPRVFIDPEIERQSSALHSFLLGQLAYLKEDYSEAIKGLGEASRLAGKPEPVLDSRLAELYVRSGNLNEALAACDRVLQQEFNNRNVLLLKAGILEALGRTAEAEPLYQQVISDSPAQFEAWVLLASLYEKQGELEKSVRLLEEFVKEKPDETLGHYYLGRAYELQNNLDQAEKQFRVALRKERGSSDIAASLIRVLAKRNDFQAVKDLCEELLEHDQNNLLARRILGQVLIGEKRLDEALEHLRVLETSESDPTSTRFKIALIEIEKQNTFEAIRELNLVLAREPAHQEARYNLAALLAGTGRAREAVDELMKITPEQSLYVKSRTFAAFLLRQMDDLKSAEKAAREAVAGAGSDKQSLSYLILILRDAKKYREAEGLLKEALEEDPQNVRLLFSYGVVLQDLKRISESLQVMEKVVELDPQHSDAMNYIAYTLAEEGRDLERALDLVKRALGIRPNDGFYLDTEGWIYFKLGRYKEAEETLARAVGITGEDPEILEHYGDALVATNNPQKAYEVYRAALEKFRDAKRLDDKSASQRIERKLQSLSSKAD